MRSWLPANALVARVHPLRCTTPHMSLCIPQRTLLPFVTPFDPHPPLTAPLPTASRSTFFMAPRMTSKLLFGTWTRQIEPLIAEYFFDQPDRLTDFTLGQFWPSIW